MLSEYRQRTEFNLPHTQMLVEDVMFVNQNKLVALEYIFYNKQSLSKYYEFQKVQGDLTPRSLIK